MILENQVVQKLKLDFWFLGFRIWFQLMQRKGQESRREGWTDAAIMLCKLNKSL